MKTPNIALCAALLASAFMAPQASAEQFVLFDETFTLTKEQADADRSHVFLDGDRVNPERPKDWTSPVDYRNGSIHTRLEVLEKPAGEAPVLWTICYIPNVGQGNGYGCTITDLYQTTGVYDKDYPMTKFWENESIIWSEGVKRIDLILKDDSGGKGHAHKRPDPERYFPTKIRLTAIQVAKGETYDPAKPSTLPQ